MGNPTNIGKFREGEYHEECERPLTGCDFPDCRCDVSEDE